MNSDVDGDGFEREVRFRAAFDYRERSYRPFVLPWVLVLLGLWLVTDDLVDAVGVLPLALGNLLIGVILRDRSGS